MFNNNSSNFSQSRLDYSGHHVIPGLLDSVEILRDAIGVPHVRARHVTDAFFSQGFVHAQDRLWQMESDRARAYGRVSAFMGPRTIHQDTLWRSLCLEENAQKDLRESTPEVQAMFEAYAKGVNAFLALGILPPESQALKHIPESWQPWDCIAVFKARHLGMGRWEHKLWRLHIAQKFGTKSLQLLFPTTPQYRNLPAHTPHVMSDINNTVLTFGDRLVHSDSDEGGSNNWVLSGARTTSGKPILAGDPHRAIEVPNVYYQNHLQCDDFDVIGFSFPGVPGIPHFGHNAEVAWSITHAAADTQDLFIEELNVENNAYRRGDAWIPLACTQADVNIRGADPLTVTIRKTSEGPIIDQYGQLGLVLKAASLQSPNGTGQAILSMLYARTGRELDEAMSDWVDPVNNLLYADKLGNIGYRLRGRLPIRPLTNAWVPVSASSQRHSWQGYVPFQSMYHVANPDSGYLVTANNQVVPDTYPHYVALDFAASHRRDRIEEILLSRERWAAHDMTEIHQDVVSLSARKMIPQMRMSHPVSPSGQKLLALLQSWNAEIRHDSIAPLVYNTIRRVLVQAIMRSVTDAAFLDRWASATPLFWQTGRLTGHLTDILSGAYPEVTQHLQSVHPNLFGEALEEAAARLGYHADGALPT